MSERRATVAAQPADLDTQTRVEQFARETADTVYDPCGMAMGLQVGLTEMGLVRSVTAERIAEGWSVQLHLRLTSPGCQYFFYFQQELEARLLAHPEVAAATVRWDERLDWTPGDLAPSAREKVAERQARLRPLPVTPSTR